MPFWPARLVHTPYLKLACLFTQALARSALDQEAMGKGNTGFTRRVAGNHRTRVKKTSAGGAPEAADASLASPTAISYAYIEKVLMPPYLAAVRSRNGEVEGSAMWEELDKEAEKWQGRAFEALNALDDCFAQSLTRVRRRRLVLVSP